MQVKTVVPIALLARVCSTRRIGMPSRRRPSIGAKISSTISGARPSVGAPMQQGEAAAQALGRHPHGRLVPRDTRFLAAVLACRVQIAAVPALSTWLPQVTLGRAQETT